jgi:hypothetical protein
MNLIQVATSTLSSPASTFSITGITSNNIHILTFHNWQSSDDTVTYNFRVTNSGTTNSSAIYSSVAKNISSAGGNSNNSLTNNTLWQYSFGGNGTAETQMGIWYLYDFADSSKFSRVYFAGGGFSQTPNLITFLGGVQVKSAQADDGITFVHHAGNVETCTTTIYKVV